MESIISRDAAVSSRFARIPNTIAYYYAFIVLGSITGVFGPTLTALAQQTQTTLGEISLIFATRSFGYLIGSFLSGRLYDRIKGHPLLVLVLVVTAVAFILIPLVPALWLLIAIVFILGLAEGSIDVGGNSLLMWMHGTGSSPFLNGLHFFFGVGAFISPIIVAQVVLSTGGIAWAYWLLAIIIAPVTLALIRLPSPPPRQRSHTDPRVQANVLMVASIVVFFFLYVGAEVGYGNWVFTYATRLNLSNATDAALLTSAFWGAFTLGRLFAIPLSTRFKPAVILLVDLIGSMASVVGIAVFSQSTTALWLGTLGIGVFMASIFPMMLALAGRKMTITGEITGLFLVGAGCGGMFFPWFIGQLFEPIGAGITTLLVFANLLVALVLLSIVLGNRRKNAFVAAK